MRFSFLGFAALSLTFSAFAGEDIMAGCYGNTVIGKSTLGQSHTHYRADHTFDAALSSDQGSMDTDGAWALNDKGETCRTYNTPVPGFPNPSCVPWSAHKVGDLWQITFNGRTTDLSLVAGIQ